MHILSCFLCILTYAIYAFAMKLLPLLIAICFCTFIGWHNTQAQRIALLSIYEQDLLQVYVTQQQENYFFYRARDNVCIGRWDGQTLWLGQSQIVRGYLNGQEALDTHQKLLFLLRWHSDTQLILEKPFLGSCLVIQNDLSLLPGTQLYWLSDKKLDTQKKLYLLAIYFIYFHPRPLC